MRGKGHALSVVVEERDLAPRHCSCQAHPHLLQARAFEGQALLEDNEVVCGAIASLDDFVSGLGRISGMDTKGTRIIKAQVPMAEMLNYQNDLTSMTQGRATYAMEFDHYDFVPSMQADKVIAAAKAGEEEEEE